MKTLPESSISILEIVVKSKDETPVRKKEAIMALRNIGGEKSWQILGQVVNESADTLTDNPETPSDEKPSDPITPEDVLFEALDGIRHLVRGNGPFPPDDDPTIKALEKTVDKYLPTSDFGVPGNTASALYHIARVTLDHLKKDWHYWEPTRLEKIKGKEDLSNIYLVKRAFHFQNGRYGVPVSTERLSVGEYKINDGKKSVLIIVGPRRDSVTLNLDGRDEDIKKRIILSTKIRRGSGVNEIILRAHNAHEQLVAFEAEEQQVETCIESHTTPPKIVRKEII
jgi:hypothetical protein